MDEVSPEQDTNPVNDFPKNAQSLMDMDTDLDNTETRTETPENPSIEEDDFKFIISERKRGVTTPFQNRKILATKKLPSLKIIS